MVNLDKAPTSPRFEPILSEVDLYDSYQVGGEVCKLMAEGVAAIFGPQSPYTWNHVQSQCDNKEMPHIASNRWDPQKSPGSCLLNLYPHPEVLAQAIEDIVRAWNWKGFTVVYDDFYSLKKIGNLLKMADDKGFVVTVRQLEGEDGNFRKILQGIKHSGEKNIVFQCSVDILYEVLLQSQQVGLVGSEYNYIITSLDFQYIDLEPFKWSGTNMTGIRIVKPTTDYFKKVVAPWFSEENGDGTDEEEGDNYDMLDDQHMRRKRFQNTGYGDISDPEIANEEDQLEGEAKEADEDGDNQPEEETPEEPIKIPMTQTALIHDGVQLFAKAIENLGMQVSPRSIDCDQSRAWEHGYSVRNYMKMSEYEGLSGLIKFDYQGFRTDIELEIIELTEEGLIAKGIWNTTTGLNVHYPEGKNGQTDVGEDLRNTTFIVLIALTHPYGMLKEASKPLSGNDRFEGFGIDLIHELSLMSGFNYTFVVREDKSSGNPLKSGKWTGMIGDVLDGRADLAIADITITRERERDADFTMPFMNLGISILYKKPKKAPPSTFSFLSPFSAEVWAYMLSAYFGVSLLLFVIGRVSPYEWTNKYPCIEDPKELENQFTLLNSYWFTIGSLMQQGSDLAPIAVSTRMVAAIWWFFTLIMVSSYTANLAAFLTVEVTVSPFLNVDGLANQKTIKYGAKAGGATANFFRDSNLTLYQQMWKYMESNSDVMMPTNEAGVRRVMENDDYAFLMESTSIEYEVERKCELHQIGGLLDNKGYGIVMRQNSSYRNVLSRNVVKLQEKGKLTQLKNKWWREKRGGGACAVKSEGGAASELGLANVGGVFLVLLAGCILSIFFALAELSWDIISRDDKISFIDEFKKELKFISKCHGTTKPVIKNSKTDDSGSDTSKGTEEDLELD
ncbi:glutamate receptor ionotropic, kainate 2-like isoform X2 [Cimex lectularius]|nr:glutamate receptor ionotropic, kainate 2-like isoform X2 [Cimex lectularius]